MNPLFPARSAKLARLHSGTSRVHARGLQYNNWQHSTNNGVRKDAAGERVMASCNSELSTAARLGFGDGFVGISRFGVLRARNVEPRIPGEEARRLQMGANNLDGHDRPVFGPCKVATRQ